MTILVTGGAGFIGSNFLHQAVNCFSEKIICVDNLSYASDYEQIKDLPIEFCNANIIDQHYCDYIFKKYKPKTIFHFAAESHVDNSIDSSSFIHRGIAERSFSRQFRLADNIEVTNAELVNGMLIISLHRNIPEAELPKQIEIKTPSRKILSKKAA